MKKIHILSIFLIIVSCNSQQNFINSIEIYKTENPLISVQNISYVEPIIDMSTKEAKESRTKFYFYKYRKKALDSILSKETGIFEFNQKVSIAASDDLIQSIRLNLDSLIRSIYQTRSIENLTMPSVFNSLENNGVENIIVTFIQPRFIKNKGSNSSGSSINIKSTTKSLSHRLDTTKNNFFVFNVKTRKLLLYSSTQKLSPYDKQNFINYLKTILTHLEEA